MPNKPILTRIEDFMQSLIESMAPGAYHYSWAVNCQDRSKVTFPLANIYLESDTSLDAQGGSSNGMYMHESVYRITVTTKLEQEMGNPLWDINTDLNRCLDDLLAVFGKNPTLGGNTDVIMYQGMTRTFSRNGDLLIPTFMETKWLLTWESDRRYPDHDA